MKKKENNQQKSYDEWFGLKFFNTKKRYSDKNEN